MRYEEKVKRIIRKSNNVKRGDKYRKEDEKFKGEDKMSNAGKTMERRKMRKKRRMKKGRVSIEKKSKGEEERNEREGCTDGAKVEDDTDGVKEKYDKG